MADFEPRSVRVAAGDVTLPGELTIPPGAKGIVLFAHGSGSSRLSPRNQFVAQELVRSGLATLLFDLLTPLEDQDYRKRFDVLLLAHRLLKGADWVRDHDETRGLRVGYFGASTGAAAAIIAAAARPGSVGAIVSRGGRPDLAFDALDEVDAPTLLIVGGADPEVLQLNREAYERLRCEKRLEIIPGATHLFEEPGALEAVARLATAWFRHYLVEQPAPGPSPDAQPPAA